MAHDPWLLTPGPLTTSATVKSAMLHYWGSRDAGFIAINNRMRRRLVELIGGGEDFTTVPMQGSGTFAVEAMLGSFVGPKDKLLILINGAYGKRMAKICEYYHRAVAVLEWPEDQPVDISTELMRRRLSEGVVPPGVPTRPPKIRGLDPVGPDPAQAAALAQSSPPLVRRRAQAELAAEQQPAPGSQALPAESAPPAFATCATASLTSIPFAASPHGTRVTFAWQESVPAQETP